MSTIAAISTATGTGGIGIIRISGEKSFEILQKIFVPINDDKIKGYKMKYGHIVDSKTKRIIDEVLVSYFIKPKSYTTEDMCEINSHGGRIVLNKILQECLENGATLAEPGEFTKRAFLKGRIDLAQAEAVIDIINAKTDKEMRVAQDHLEGDLSKKINEIKQELMSVMVDIEATIDYPEYDIEEITNNKIYNMLNSIEIKLEKLEKSFENGKILKDGIKTAIIGKPNVGKSSLLNLILGENRAIVSNIEGTTRDIIEEYVNINGIPLKIMDTAGIRKTNDEIEKIGVKKTIDNISNAELVFAVFDDSREFEEEDRRILELVKNKNTIIIINKIDLQKNIIKNNKEIKQSKKYIIEISTLKENGIEELYSTIEKMFNIGNIENDDTQIITNIRQKNNVTKALKAIKKAKQSLQENMPVDIIAITLKEILENLSEITGEKISEEIINEIFKKFCLGK